MVSKAAERSRKVKLWPCKHPLMLKYLYGFQEGQFQLSKASYMQNGKDYIISIISIHKLTLKVFGWSPTQQTPLMYTVNRNKRVPGKPWVSHFRDHFWLDGSNICWAGLRVGLNAIDPTIPCINWSINRHETRITRLLNEWRSRIWMCLSSVCFVSNNNYSQPITLNAQRWQLERACNRTIFFRRVRFISAGSPAVCVRL